MINESVRRAVNEMGVVLEGPSAGHHAAHDHLQDAHDSLSSHVAELKRRGKYSTHFEQMLKGIRDIQQRLKDDK